MSTTTKPITTYYDNYNKSLLTGANKDLTIGLRDYVEEDIRNGLISYRGDAVLAYENTNFSSSGTKHDGIFYAYGDCLLNNISRSYSPLGNDGTYGAKKNGISYKLSYNNVEHTSSREYVTTSYGTSGINSYNIINSEYTTNAYSDNKIVRCYKQVLPALGYNYYDGNIEKATDFTIYIPRNNLNYIDITYNSVLSRVFGSSTLSNFDFSYTTRIKYIDNLFRKCNVDYSITDNLIEISGTGTNTYVPAAIYRVTPKTPYLIEGIERYKSASPNVNINLSVQDPVSVFDPTTTGLFTSITNNRELMEYMVYSSLESAYQPNISSDVYYVNKNTASSDRKAIELYNNHSYNDLYTFQCPNDSITTRLIFPNELSLTAAENSNVIDFTFTDNMSGHNMTGYDEAQLYRLVYNKYTYIVDNETVKSDLSGSSSSSTFSINKNYGKHTYQLKTNETSAEQDFSLRALVGGNSNYNFNYTVLHACRKYRAGAGTSPILTLSRPFPAPSRTATQYTNTSGKSINTYKISLSLSKPYSYYANPYDTNTYFDIYVGYGTGSDGSTYTYNNNPVITHCNGGSTSYNIDVDIPYNISTQLNLDSSLRLAFKIVTRYETDRSCDNTCYITELTPSKLPTPVVTCTQNDSSRILSWTINYRGTGAIYLIYKNNEYITTTTSRTYEIQNVPYSGISESYYVIAKYDYSNTQYEYYTSQSSTITINIIPYIIKNINVVQGELNDGELQKRYITWEYNASTVIPTEDLVFNIYFYHQQTEETIVENLPSTQRSYELTKDYLDEEIWTVEAQNINGRASSSKNINPIKLDISNFNASQNTDTNNDYHKVKLNWDTQSQIVSNVNRFEYYLSNSDPIFYGTNGTSSNKINTLDRNGSISYVKIGPHTARVDFKYLSNDSYSTYMTTNVTMSALPAPTLYMIDIKNNIADVNGNIHEVTTGKKFILYKDNTKATRVTGNFQHSFGSSVYIPCIKPLGSFENGITYYTKSYNLTTDTSPDITKTYYNKVKDIFGVEQYILASYINNDFIPDTNYYEVSYTPIPAINPPDSTIQYYTFDNANTWVTKMTSADSVELDTATGFNYAGTHSWRGIATLRSALINIYNSSTSSYIDAYDSSTSNIEQYSVSVLDTPTVIFEATGDQYLASKLKWNIINHADYYIVTVVGDNIAKDYVIANGTSGLDTETYPGYWRITLPMNQDNSAGIVPDSDFAIISRNIRSGQTVPYTVYVRAMSYDNWYYGGSHANLDNLLTYTLIKLPAPSNLIWDSGTSTLSWNAVSDANLYVINGTSGSSTITPISTSNTSAEIIGLSLGSMTRLCVNAYRLVEA